MPITQISIENYRGIGQKQTLRFAKPDRNIAGSGLSVLVGPNNSGKSTILRVINAIYSNDPEFTAEMEDRRGTDTYPSITLAYEIGGKHYEIATQMVGRSAYLSKTGDVAAALNQCQYLPARRPWRDRFHRNIGYTRDAYERDLDRHRKSDDYYVDQNFGTQLHAIERDARTKGYFLDVLKFIEATITDFWVDRSTGADFLAFESASGFPHRAGIVGEGILNIFRLCYSLIFQQESEVLLVDEPELSLHPQSQRRLYQLLANRTKYRQVVTSTHSVHFIDWGHIRTGTKIFRANLSPAGSTFNSLSDPTIAGITGITDRDILNKKLFDTLAKELFFSRGCVLVEGQEDAHLLQKYIDGVSNYKIEIFGYGSGGADGILHWLAACSDLKVRAVGLFDGDEKGSIAFSKAKKQFEGIEDIMIKQIPTPDIRDKYKRKIIAGQKDVIAKQGLLTVSIDLKEKYSMYMRELFDEISVFLNAKQEAPPFTLP